MKFSAQLTSLNKDIKLDDSIPSTTVLGVWVEGLTISQLLW